MLAILCCLWQGTAQAELGPSPAPDVDKNRAWVAAHLAEAGYFQGDIKNAQPDAVREAIGLFQRDLGVPVTGRLDTAAWSKLETLRLSNKTKTTLGIPIFKSLPRAQSHLASLGYEIDDFSGELTEKTRRALAGFQQDAGVPVSGELTLATANLLNQAVERQALDAIERTNASLPRSSDVTTPPPLPPAPAPPPPETHDPAPAMPDVPVPSPPPQPAFDLADNEPVFVVETTECKSSTEMWALFYRGQWTEQDEETLAVRVNERYALWYDSRYEGETDADWWCIPHKKICYSKAPFSDWGGQLQAGDIQRFAKADSIPTRLSLEPLLTWLFAQRCGRPVAPSTDVLPASWSTETLMDLISTRHYRRPPREAMHDAFSNPADLNAYLHTLDPYSRYLPPAQYAFRQQRAAREQIGLGVNILLDEDDALLVPLYQGPTYRAGLRAPHYLNRLRGKKVSMEDFTSYRFLTELDPGTTVPVRVYRDAERQQTRDYTVTAAPFSKTPIEYWPNGERELIRIHGFTPGSARQLEDRLRQALDSDKPLVLDLRYCPGGDVYETVDALSLFLPPDLLVGYVREANDKAYELRSLPGRIAADRPIELWVSPFTASAAEVFVRALKAFYPQSRIIGTPTQGKCLSQEMIEFGDGAALQLTVAEVLGPDRLACESTAIQPDVAVDSARITEDEAYIEAPLVGR